MRTLTVLLVSICFFVSSSASRAEGADTGPKLFAATKIDDHRIDALVILLLNTYITFKEGIVFDRTLRNGPEKINFYYASGKNFIVGQRIAENVLTPLFDGKAVADITHLPTNSDDCFVQSFVLNNDQRIVLAVHNDNGDDAEDIIRCLTAGLWTFEGGKLSELDVMNWRSSLARLFFQSSN